MIGIVSYHHSADTYVRYERQKDFIYPFIQFLCLIVEASVQDTAMVMAKSERTSKIG